MENNIDLDEMGRNIIKTTASLLSLEEFQFDIKDEDFVFTEKNVETSYQTKNIFSVHFGKPLYCSSAKTIPFDDNFRKHLRFELKTS